jgi:hypothetical protein
LVLFSNISSSPIHLGSGMWESSLQRVMDNIQTMWQAPTTRADAQWSEQMLPHRLIPAEFSCINDGPSTTWASQACPFKVQFLLRPYFQGFLNSCKKYFHVKIKFFVSMNAKIMLLISNI